MTRQITLALVVARPDHLWSGLHSLLRTVPQIEVIAEVNDAYVLLSIGAEIQPQLILLDAGLFDEDTWPGLTKIKGEWPRTQFVALVEDDQQRGKALEAGVDHVLAKGFPASRLITLIEDLVSRSGKGGRIEPDLKEITLANSDTDNEGETSWARSI